MYSMSFVSSRLESMASRIRSGDRLEGKTFQDHDIMVTPFPSAWEDSIKSMRMTFEDAQDRLSVFERFERPFVFDHLPTPLSGKLKMMIEALDERGEVLPGSGEQFGFEVESPDVVAEEVSDQEVSDQEDTPQAAQALLTSSDEPAAGTGPALLAEPAPLATAALIAPESFTTLRIEAEDLSDDDGDGNASSIVGPVSRW